MTIVHFFSYSDLITEVRDLIHTLKEQHNEQKNLITVVRDLIHTLNEQHSEQKKKGFDFSSTLSIMVLGLTFSVPEIVIRIIVEFAKHIKDVCNALCLVWKFCKTCCSRTKNTKKMNKDPETADLFVDYNGERKAAMDYLFNKSSAIVSVLIVNGLDSFFFRRRNANQIESLQNYKQISLMARRADESLNISYEEGDFKVTESSNPLYIFVSARVVVIQDIMPSEREKTRMRTLVANLSNNIADSGTIDFRSLDQAWDENLSVAVINS
jgi:hypothetical protein